MIPLYWCLIPVSPYRLGPSRFWVLGVCTASLRRCDSLSLSYSLSLLLRLTLSLSLPHSLSGPPLPLRCSPTSQRKTALSRGVRDSTALSFLPLSLSSLSLSLGRVAFSAGVGRDRCQVLFRLASTRRYRAYSDSLLLPELFHPVRLGSFTRQCLSVLVSLFPVAWPVVLSAPFHRDTLGGHILVPRAQMLRPPAAREPRRS